ncbi:SIMPL domain-containing protein, partial [Sandarakinorhabdus sp.]|uniref:SIMPL domain-containing protein n=1 Tax=Sandarakinorhabdus sp. TaxID=1916663 RepID=UPI003340A39D
KADSAAPPPAARPFIKPQPTLHHSLRMKRILLLALLVAAPAMAQTPPATIGQPFIPAPWWMKDPVIASMGHVRSEVPANRARFAARFSVVEKTAAAGASAAAAKARALDAALAALGATRVRLTTSLSTRPLYDQYRQKDGSLVDNERADRIEAYEVTAVLAIDVRDMALLERAYRLTAASQPSAIDRVYFELQPDNEMKTALFEAAVKDAARRARLASAAAGARLGPVKVIDPTGGVCQTQVLAGWPSYGAAGPPTDVDARQIMVTGKMLSSPAPPAPASAEATLEDRANGLQVTLQPPLEELNAQACVIYGLLGPG